MSHLITTPYPSAAASRSELPWFALRVRPKHEKQVTHILTCLGQEPFLPLYQERHRWSQRWRQVDLPLFPGYVFCRFDRSAWASVANAPGVIDAVRFGKTLAPVDATEIESLRLAQQSSCPMLPADYLAVGRPVRLEAGPLTGATGRVLLDEGEAHLLLSVDLLQRSVRIKIDRDWIVALPEASVFAVPTPGTHVSATR